MLGWLRTFGCWVLLDEPKNLKCCMQAQGMTLDELAEPQTELCKLPSQLDSTSSTMSGLAVRLLSVHSIAYTLSRNVPARQKEKRLMDWSGYLLCFIT